MMTFSPLSLFGRRRGIASALPDAPVPAAGPSELDALTAKISSLTAERDRAISLAMACNGLPAKLEALQEEHFNMSNELCAVKSERDAAFAERDAAKALAAKTREEITAEVRQIELASLAASQGIPAAEIVPASGPGEQTDDQKIQALKDGLKAAKTPVERQELLTKNKALIMGRN